MIDPTRASSLPRSRRRIRDPLMLATAMLLAVLEGADLAAIGYTLSRISATLGLSPAQGGMIASATLFGFAVGAALGGMLSDRYGRRPIMVGSIIALGFGSIATPLAWDYSALLIIRFVCGIGLGGLMPPMIALGRDAAEPPFRSMTVSIILASGTFGAMLAGFITLHGEWRTVFYVGGLTPLILLPVVWRKAKEPTRREPMAIAIDRLSVIEILSGEGRLSGTILIWLVALTTSLSIYLLMNWLPSLLEHQGFSRTESQLALIVYTVGGLVGNLMGGFLMERVSARSTYVLGYLGAACCILGITVFEGIYFYIMTFGLNLFMLSAHTVTVALTPGFYPVVAQTTGIGGMVAAGRLGSILGPVMAGLLLQTGLASSQILQGLAPVYCLSLGLALLFVVKLRSRQMPSRRHVPAHQNTSTRIRQP